MEDLLSEINDLKSSRRLRRQVPEWRSETAGSLAAINHARFHLLFPTRFFLIGLTSVGFGAGVRCSISQYCL